MLVQQKNNVKNYGVRGLKTNLLTTICSG